MRGADESGLGGRRALVWPAQIWADRPLLGGHCRVWKMRRKTQFPPPHCLPLGGGGMRTPVTETRGLLALKRALYSVGGRAWGWRGWCSKRGASVTGAGGTLMGRGHWHSNASGTFGGLYSPATAKEGHPCQALLRSALGEWLLSLSPAHGGSSAPI